MRSAYEPAPWLAPLNTPSVSAATGLGTGGGAGVQTPDSSGFGSVVVIIGTGWTSNGSVALQFPSTPPNLFLSGSQSFGTLSQNTVGNVVTISWIGASFVPGRHLLQYEWSVSK
jgi:hypothetical protein